jgi:hypothetical protein
MTKNIETPWGEIGFITYKRTYARLLKNGLTEEFTDTVERELQALDKQLKLRLSAEEQDFYREMRLKLKGSVAGRFMWQLGTKTVDKLGLASLQNCAGTIVDDPVRPFIWAMDMLMLGSGVGYSIKKEHVYNIPKLKGKIKIERFDDKSADFIVPDTREGWIKLLGKTLKAHFYSGQGFTYSTQLIRGKGAPISGFGGTASGPEDLCWGIEEISNILNNRSHKKLRPIDCLDIMNIIGRIVVAGNVRRSAQLAIGDSDDIEYLRAKRWDLGHIPNWRNMSNNSVDCENVEDLPAEFWETYEQGEPYGLVNLRLSRLVGRLGETQYPDADVQIYNPCQPDFATVIIKERGLSTFKDLKIGDEIWSKQGWTKVLNKWSTGVKPVFDFRTTSGVFTGTANHRVDTPIGKVEVDTAESILTIGGESFSKSTEDLQSVVDGLFFGDGYFKKREGYKSYPLLVIGKNDSDYFNSNIAGFIKNKFQGDESREEFEVSTTITETEKVRAYDLRIPKRFFSEKNKLSSFLKGLYSADGSVILNVGNSCRISYKTSSKGLAEDVQLALSYLGIRSYITVNKPSNVTFNNGTYLCKESYDVNVSSDRSKFMSNIGFIHEYKNQKALSNMGETMNKNMFSSLKEKTYLGDFEVYDITVDNDSHTYWTGGLSVSNCAEQSLADKETCCLAEVYLPNIESEKELWEVTKMLYRVNKHSLALPCHLKDTEEIVHNNMRMGIGITGVMMSTPEQLSWLDITYKKLRAYDEEYSKNMGWPKSIKLTTIKPSGSLSLLAGVTPGVHPSPAGPYYIRRIRMAADSNLVDVCRTNGYPVEFQRNFDGTVDKSTAVVSFPCKIPEWVKVGKDVDVLDQLEMVKNMQTVWSDNSVSVTAYYGKDDIQRIKEYLKENWRDSFKTLSFLLYHGHGFDQAPYEEISKEVYDEMSSKTTKITVLSINEEDISEKEIGCVGGHCPIK